MQIGTEWCQRDNMLSNVMVVENEIGTERNLVYCNVEVSLWNVTRGNESDWGGLEWNESQHYNII